MCIALAGGIGGMLSGVMGMVGSVVSGIGAAQQAKAQAEAYRAQAKLHDRQARAERIKGAYEADKQQREGKRVMGSQRAAFAASGLIIEGSESAMELVSDTSAELDLDVQAIRFGSVLRSSNEKYEGKIARMNAKAADQAAGIAMLSPIIGGFGSMAKGFA